VFEICKDIGRRMKKIEGINAGMVIEDDENKMKKSQAKKSKHKESQEEQTTAELRMTNKSKAKGDK
jgi:hypothetical protein